MVKPLIKTLCVFSSQSFSRVSLWPHEPQHGSSSTLCDSMNRTSLSITNSWSPLKLRSIKLVMPSNHLTLCLPLGLEREAVLSAKRVVMSVFLLQGLERVLSSQSCLFVTLWTVVHQIPLSMVFPSLEYWSGLPFTPPGDLSDSGIEPASPTLVGKFFTSESRGKLINTTIWY